MNAMFPPLRPGQLRSRILKDLYNKFVEDNEVKIHVSPSGLTAHYIAARCTEDRIGFILNFVVSTRHGTYYTIQRRDIHQT